MNEMIDKQVFSILKQKYSEPGFSKFMDELIVFYGRKIMRLAKTETEEKYIEEEFHRLVKSEFFMGYRAMYLIMEDEEIQGVDDLLTCQPGILLNEIPVLIGELFKDVEGEWYRIKEAQEVSMWLTQNIEGSYDLLRQTKKDCAMYGCYHAALDRSQYKKESFIEQFYKLEDPFDIHFLNPQVYMKAEFITEEQEMWNVHAWNALDNGGKFIGTIHLFRTEQSFYILSISLMDEISSDEKYDIADKISVLLPEELRPFTQIRLNQLSDFTLLVPTLKESQTVIE